MAGFEPMGPRVRSQRPRAKGTLPKEGRTMYENEPHTHRPTAPEEPGSGLVGYAAIKYTAIVVIVLAILAFLGLYVLPRVT